MEHTTLTIRLCFISFFSTGDQFCPVFLKGNSVNQHAEFNQRRWEGREMLVIAIYNACNLKKKKKKWLTAPLG